MSYTHFLLFITKYVYNFIVQPQRHGFAIVGYNYHAWLNAGAQVKIIIIMIL